MQVLVENIDDSPNFEAPVAVFARQRVNNAEEDKLKQNPLVTKEI